MSERTLVTRGARLLVAPLLVLAALLPGAAFAHSTTYAVYSKYEAVAAGRTVAFVFALDRDATLRWLERDVTGPGHKAQVDELARHQAEFAAYLFARFFVANDGVGCSHPAALSRFGWDEATRRVLAVTHFTCKGDLNDLQIRSLVTHDLPIAHQLVGDLVAGQRFERNSFVDDDVVAQISLRGPARPALTRPAGRRSGRFVQRAMPDKRRRYGALAARELLAAEAAEGPPLAVALGFAQVGLRHGALGWEHLALALTLLSGLLSPRGLTRAWATFCAGHVVARALAAQGLVVLAAGLVEPLLALSLLAVVVDAFRRGDAGPRGALVATSGVAHGLFASALVAQLGAPPVALSAAGLGFDLGLAVAQLALLALLYPVARWLRGRATSAARTRVLVCGSVALVTLVVLALRVQAAFIG